MVLGTHFHLAAQLRSVRQAVLVALLLLALAALALAARASFGGAPIVRAGAANAHPALLADGPNVPCGGTLFSC